MAGGGVTGSITQQGPRGVATIASLNWEKREPERSTAPGPTTSRRRVTYTATQRTGVVRHAAGITISLVCAVLRCGQAGGSADHPGTPQPHGGSLQTNTHQHKIGFYTGERATIGQKETQSTGRLALPSRDDHRANCVSLQDPRRQLTLDWSPEMSLTSGQRI